MQNCQFLDNTIQSLPKDRFKTVFPLIMWLQLYITFLALPIFKWKALSNQGMEQIKCFSAYGCRNCGQRTATRGLVYCVLSSQGEVSFQKLLSEDMGGCNARLPQSCAFRVLSESSSAFALWNFVLEVEFTTFTVLTTS